MAKQRQSIINRDRVTIDAEGKILGKLAVECADKLRGKSKVSYSPQQDVGDFVVVINPRKIAVTGSKMTQKIYRRHSGYLGNLRQSTLKEQMSLSPSRVVRHAVAGMLPKNRLSKTWLKRLSFKEE